MPCPHCGDVRIIRYGLGYVAPLKVKEAGRDYERYTPVDKCPYCKKLLLGYEDRRSQIDYEDEPEGGFPF